MELYPDSTIYTAKKDYGWSRVLSYSPKWQIQAQIIHIVAGFKCIADFKHITNKNALIALFLLNTGIYILYFTPSPGGEEIWKYELWGKNIMKKSIPQ